MISNKKFIIKLYEGAAIESFRSRIISYLNKFNELQIKNNELIRICDEVAKDFQIQLGTNTIPMLLNENNQSIDFDNDLVLDNQNKKYTGKILIDLSDGNDGIIQLEYESLTDQSIRLIETLVLNDAKLTHDCIAELLKLSLKENVEFIQMFDVSMLLSNAAFDDNTIMECVLEKKDEWQQYKRSMAIFDVDSLIGVTENMSDSSMGQSNSYSITNNRLWQQVVIQTCNSNLSSLTQGGVSNRSDHKWVVVVTKNKFICKQFKSQTRFPLTEEEEKDMDENAMSRKCLNCESNYTNSKNSIDSCQYHDGPLIDSKATEYEMFHIKKDTLVSRFAKASGDKRPDMFKDYVFLCCFQAYNSTGCKKDFHSDENDLKNNEKYEKYLNKGLI